MTTPEEEIKCSITRKSLPYSYRVYRCRCIDCVKLHRKYAKIWRLNNPAKAKASRRRYYLQNKVKIKIKVSLRRTTSISAIYSIYKSQAKVRKIEFMLSFDEFKSFWREPCHYCNSPIKTIGLDRIDPSQGYNIWNIVSCCGMCNYMKLDYTLSEFFGHINKLAENIGVLNG